MQSGCILNWVKCIKQPFGENSIGNLDVWSFNAEQWDQKRVQMGELIANHKQQ